MKPKDFPVNYLVTKKDDSTIFCVSLCPLVTNFSLSTSEKGLDCIIYFDQAENELYKGAISIEYFRDTAFHIPYEWPSTKTYPTLQLALTSREATITILHK